MATTELALPKNVSELRQRLMALLPGAKSRYPDLPITSSDIVLLARSAERNTELLHCQPATIMGALVEARSMGWTVDGLTGQAYLVPFAKKAVLMPGYRGMMDLVRRSGVCEPSMDAIHDCDVWQWSGNTFDKPTIRASDVPDRRSRPIVGAYAQGFFFTQGFTKTFHWTYQQILAHRDKYSQGWKRNRKPDNPWHPENPGHWVMCAKTVLIDAIKRGLPVSQQDLRIVQRIELSDRVVDAAGWQESPGDDVAADIESNLTADPVTATEPDPLEQFRAEVESTDILENLKRKYVAFEKSHPDLRDQAAEIVMLREEALRERE